MTAPGPHTVLVTGASGGLGAAIVRAALAGGWQCAAAGRDKARLDELRETVPAAHAGRLLTVTADPADWDDVQAAVLAARDRFGRLDAIVPNAGFSSGGDMLTTDPAADREMVLVNVLGPALLVKAAAASLIDSGGLVVLIGSIAGVKNLPGSLYGATKFAITGLAENLRMSLAPHGVGVTLVVPGYVDTPFHEGRALPVAMTPAAVADAVLWALGQSGGMDVNTITVRARAQAV
jgi:NADP-dependent 3-hydroxy acid dehydrogenase YdfG